VVEFQEVWVQNCLVTSFHFQASSHFCNQNTFNLQDWLILIACRAWSKYFVKITFKENISCFQNNKETKKRHVSLKDEMWPQNKRQHGKIHNKMIDNSAPFLDQLLWPYLCFAERFRSLVILMMFWWQNDRWHHLSQTQLDSWKSCICWTKMAQKPTMIFTSRLNYTTVVACNLSKSGQQVWNLADVVRQT